MMSYLDKYDVLKNFKTNDYQKVLIASDKENPDKVVVINIINKENTSTFLSRSQIPKGLNNLIHLEEVNNDIIIVTDYLEGTSFSTYINYLETTLKHKTGLAFEYLNKILCYDAFNNSIKKILIGENQITFKDNYIYFNELLLIDEEPSNVSTSDVNTEIANVLEKILFSGKLTDLSSNSTSFVQRLREFIQKLRTSDSYKCINDVCEAFRKIYLYDMYIDDDNKTEPETFIATGAIISDSVEQPIDSVESINNDTTTTDMESNKSINESTTLTDDSVLKSSEEIIQPSDTDFEDIEQSSSNDFSHIFNDNNNKEIVLTGLSEHITQPKKAKTNTKKYIAIGCLIALLLAIGSFAMTKLPVTSVLKPVEDTKALQAHFTYSMATDDGLFQFKNDSVLSDKDAKIKSIVWKIYQDTTLLSTVKKVNPSIKFNNMGEYKIELTVVDTNDNSDTYIDTILYEKKYDIDDLDKGGTSETLNDLNLSYTGLINKDSEAYRTGSYSLKLGRDGETSTESLIINNISLEDNPVISFWVASSKIAPIDIFIEGLSNNTVLVSKRITHNPSDVLTWDRIKYNSPNSKINRVRLTFKNLSNSIWIDDIKIDYYK